MNKLITNKTVLPVWVFKTETTKKISQRVQMNQRKNPAQADTAFLFKEMA